MAGVHLCLANAAAGGIEICARSTQYINFTFVSASSDYRGRMSYINSDSSSTWYVGALAAAKPNVNLAPTGLSVIGAAISSGRM